MFVMDDYVMEMTVKKSCESGKYGLFEHLLFLFVLIVLEAEPVFQKIVYTRDCRYNCYYVSLLSCGSVPLA